MRPSPRRRTLARALTLLFVACGVVGVVMSAGSLPHTHAADRPGIYNEEHDLTLLGAVGHAVPLPVGPSIAPLAPTTALPVVAAIAGPRSQPDQPSDCRAPPAV